MDKRILEEYIDACRLAEETEEDIAKLEQKIKYVATDKVQASNPEFPYQPISVTITGSPELSRNDAELGRQMKILQERKQKCLELRTEAEAIVEQLPVRMKRIVRFYYFQGLTWDQTAAQMGGKYTGDQLRMQFNRYCEEREKERQEKFREALERMVKNE